MAELSKHGKVTGYLLSDVSEFKPEPLVGGSTLRGGMGGCNPILTKGRTAGRDRHLLESYLLACSDSGTRFTSLCSAFGNHLPWLRSSGSPEIYAGMAAGRDHWRTFSSPGKRQPLPALLVASFNLPAHFRALLLLVLMGLSEDVLEYLFWAKSAEEDVWLRDDIAISIRTVALAAEGCQDPSTVASYEVLGLHPDQVWDRIVERRKSLLGDLYDAWYGAAASSQNSSDQLPPRKQPSPASPEILPQKAKVQSA